MGFNKDMDSYLTKKLGVPRTSLVGKLLLTIRRFKTNTKHRWNKIKALFLPHDLGDTVIHATQVTIVNHALTPAQQLIQATKEYMKRKRQKVPKDVDMSLVHKTIEKHKVVR